MEQEPIRVVPYDPEWPARFGREREGYTEAKAEFVELTLGEVDAVTDRRAPE